MASNLETLKAYLAVGSEQARKGEFVEDFSMDMLIKELDTDADAEISNNSEGSR